MYQLSNKTPQVGRYETFNHHHSSRNFIERAFGVLKMKMGNSWRHPRYKPKTQKMIVIASTCLHNWIRNNKLCDVHFDTFDNDVYVQSPLLFTGANALPPEDDGNMTATCEAIAASLVPCFFFLFLVHPLL